MTETLVTKDGAIVHPALAPAPEEPGPEEAEPEGAGPEETETDV